MCVYVMYVRIVCSTMYVIIVRTYAGEIALLELGSTGSIRDNTFFAVDTDPAFVYFENHGAGSVLGAGWTLRNNTIYGEEDVEKMISPTPGVRSVVYDSHNTPLDCANYGRSVLNLPIAFSAFLGNLLKSLEFITRHVVQTVELFLNTHTFIVHVLQS